MYSFNIFSLRKWTILLRLDAASPRMQDVLSVSTQVKLDCVWAMDPVLTVSDLSLLLPPLTIPGETPNTNYTGGNTQH